MVQAEGSSLGGDTYQTFSAMIFISVLLGLVDFSDILMLGSGPNSCCQQHPPERLQSQCNYRPFILMARFLKQNFTQTCLKETDNGKLQQFNDSRSLITNRGTVERGIGRIAKNYYAPLGRET